MRTTTLPKDFLKSLVKSLIGYMNDYKIIAIVAFKNTKKELKTSFLNFFAVITLISFFFIKNEYETSGVTLSFS
jgi:hypothetical protein